MSEALHPTDPAGFDLSAVTDPAARTAEAWRTPDARRALQLALAFIWLLDGVLQYQSLMFTKGFSRMLAGTAAGNPGVIAHPITWAAGIIGDNPAGANTAFATIQLLLGLGIAWRPTLKPFLACSIGWAVAVWWLGEGLGGVLSGSANPVNGAPGAAILYALLAVLLWPVRDTGGGTGERPLRFVAEWPVGPTAAGACWVILWGSLAYFALVPSVGANDLHGMITGMQGSNPSWLSSLLRAAASAVTGRGETVSVVLAVLLGTVALGVFLPPRPQRVALGLAILLSLAIWVFGEALGSLFSNQGTDVSSGPLLVLIAAAYWPLRTRPAVPAEPEERALT